MQSNLADWEKGEAGAGSLREGRSDNSVKREAAA
jgi:hypothetical protein